MAEVTNHANRIPYQQQGREAIVDGSKKEDWGPTPHGWPY